MAKIFFLKKLKLKYKKIKKFNLTVEEREKIIKKIYQ